MSTEALLFGHLLGAFLISGGIMATVARPTAVRRERPSEVAAALRGARPALPLIAVGLVVAVVFGFRPTGRLGLDRGATWLAATFALLARLLVVGALAGRHTRERAEEPAAAGDAPSAARARPFRDPVSLLLDASLLAATIAIVALMVWKP